MQPKFRKGVLSKDKTDGLDSPQVPTRPDTTATRDAEVVIAGQKRIAIKNLEGGGYPFSGSRTYPHILSNFLEFAISELGTTALILWDI
jgi:hypothetical protein